MLVQSLSCGTSFSAGQTVRCSPERLFDFDKRVYSDAIKLVLLHNAFDPVVQCVSHVRICLIQIC